MSCPRTQHDLLLVTILQSPTDNQDNLLKKLTNYMKEKDRALQVGYVCFDFFLTLIFKFTTRRNFELRSYKHGAKMNQCPVWELNP